MNMSDYAGQKLGFWNQIKIRLEPVGLVVFIVGIFVLLAVFIAPISTNLQINLLGISLAFVFSVGLGS